MNTPLIILIIICIIFIEYYYFTHSHPKLEKDCIENMLKNQVFKTGDIILFKALDNSYAPFILNYYGHIGIVWVDPDKPYEPYIFEAASPTNLAKDQTDVRGIYLKPLESRISKYMGFTFYKELEYPLDKDTISNFKPFMQYCLQNMSYNKKIFHNSFRKGLLGEPINDHINCGELVYMSLIKLQLLPEEYYNKKIFHHLKYTTYIRDVVKNKYKKPVKILYYPF